MAEVLHDTLLDVSLDGTSAFDTYLDVTKVTVSRFDTELNVSNMNLARRHDTLLDVSSSLQSLFDTSIDVSNVGVSVRFDTELNVSLIDDLSTNAMAKGFVVYGNRQQLLFPPSASDGDLSVYIYVGASPEWQKMISTGNIYVSIVERNSHFRDNTTEESSIDPFRRVISKTGDPFCFTGSRTNNKHTIYTFYAMPFMLVLDDVVKLEFSGYQTTIDPDNEWGIVEIVVHDGGPYAANKFIERYGP